MTENTYLTKRTDITIILDNGHGAETPGKRSPVWNDGSQMFEFEFNRAVAAMVANNLSALNIPYVILVKTDKDIPLYQRCRIANKLGTKNIFGISIHSNAGGGKGFEVYTSPGETLSDKIATIMGEEFKKEFKNFPFRTDYATDGDSDKEAKFKILTGTAMPFILTENFFMDNQLECRKILMTQEGRKRIADYHTKAIIRTINELF